MTQIKPFKTYREMDDEQKKKISQHPSLHKSKSADVRAKISKTMKARWAATPHNPVHSNIYDIMLENNEPVHLTEKDIREIVSECIRRALTMLSNYSRQPIE